MFVPTNEGVEEEVHTVLGSTKEDANFEGGLHRGHNSFFGLIGFLVSGAKNKPNWPRSFYHNERDYVARRRRLRDV